MHSEENQENRQLIELKKKHKIEKTYYGRFQIIG